MALGARGAVPSKQAVRTVEWRAACVPRPCAHALFGARVSRPEVRTGYSVRGRQNGLAILGVSVRPLQRRMRRLRAAATHCPLANVKPADGGGRERLVCRSREASL